MSSKGLLPTKDQIQVEKQTLLRDDFIEWILHHTNEEWSFRIYETKHYITVGIDKEGKVEE